MSKRNIIIICIIFTVIVSGALIYYIERVHNIENSNKEIVENATKKVEIIEDNILATGVEEEEVIGPGAILIMEQYYKNCGHTVKEQYAVPEDIVNMTEEETKQYYTDWELTEFSKNEVIIKKNVEGICEEHYVVKENNGYIAIYNINAEGEQKFVENTDILTKYLPEDDKERLKEGVKVAGKTDLGSFLEDFE